MPLTSAQKKWIFQWLPNELGGKPIKKIMSGEVGPENDPPYIIFAKTVDGGVTQYHNAMIELVKNADNYFDDYWGHREKSTIYCIIASYDQRELSDLAAEFEAALYKYEYDLNWPEKRIRFLGVVSPRGLRAETQEKRGKKIYRALIDFDVEYEVKWLPDDDYIRNFDFVIRKPDGTQVLTGSRHVDVKTRTWDMKALILIHRNKTLQMMVTLKKDNLFTWQMDVKLV